MPSVKVQPTAQLRSTTDPVRTYLHEIGRVPLLSHEQEICYGKQVQQMMQLQGVKQGLEQTLNRLPTRTEWAIASTITETELDRFLHLGHQAKQKMIEANLRLVVAIAKKYQKRNLDFLDLIQEGSLGLERGVEKFDPTRGYKFSTYAYWWIRQAITRAIAQQGRSIRLPIHITEKLNKIKKTQRELSQQLGRSATSVEIAAALEIEPAQIRDYLTIARAPISLDARVGERQDTELSELLEDSGISPEKYTVQESLRQELQATLEELTRQQRDVIKLRFGLERAGSLTVRISACIPNRSKSCGRNSPSSGFPEPTKTNRAGCRMEIPSRSTVFQPLAAESSKTSTR